MSDQQNAPMASVTSPTSPKSIIPEETKNFLADSENFLKGITDPKAFWESHHLSSIKSMEALLNNFISNHSQMVSHTFNAVHRAWEDASKELSIFRELETHIVSDTMNDEKWKEIHGKLKDVRQVIYTRMQAFAAELEKMRSNTQQQSQSKPISDTQS
jgi:hypothetical protein